MVGHIPFDVTITEAMVQGEPVTSFQPDAPASQALRDIWTKVLAILQDDRS